MSITYEEALQTLESMFGEPWTRDSLDEVLRFKAGHMEETVEMILRHGGRLYAATAGCDQAPCRF